jgi:1,2-phenylacetyl-CoA epoxidase PaaB subunit
MTSHKVDIYILTKLPKDQLQAKISPLFYLLSRKEWMSQKFPGLEVNPGDEDGHPSFISIGETKKGEDADRKAVEAAIDESHRHNPDNHILVVKDTSVTASTAEDIFWTIHNFLNVVTTEPKRHKYHLLYLAKWLDRCDLYATQDPILSHPDHHLKVYKTMSPYGLQALFMTSQGARYIKEDICLDTHPEVPISISLTQWINKGKIRAATTYPDLMVFDITRAENDNDVVKTASCRQAPAINKPTQKSGNKSFFWFIIILIGVLILAWALIRIGPMAAPKGVIQTSTIGVSSSYGNSGLAVRV